VAWRTAWGRVAGDVDSAEGGGGANYFFECDAELLGAGEGNWVSGTDFLNSSAPAFFHRLTDEYAVTYIHRLGPLCSSVNCIFLGVGTEKSSIVIFLGIEEYNGTEEDTLFPIVVFCYNRVDILIRYILSL
jgi:hypothetical protein